MKPKGYGQCQSDHTMFIKNCVSERKSILIVYIDDIIITEDHIEGIQELKRFLATEFEIKNLWTLKYFLGMKVP